MTTNYIMESCKPSMLYTELFCCCPYSYLYIIHAQPLCGDITLEVIDKQLYSVNPSYSHDQKFT